jgi:hypothetical protein
MWRRLVFAAALVIGSSMGTVVGAAPAQAGSPPPVCRNYTFTGTTKIYAYGCTDVVHLTGGVNGHGNIWCDPAAFYGSTTCHATIARIRLYTADNGKIVREMTGAGGDSYAISVDLGYDCSGVRHQFQVWMTYTFYWYNQYGQVHSLDNYQSPLTSYPEYAC